MPYPGTCDTSRAQNHHLESAQISVALGILGLGMLAVPVLFVDGLIDKEATLVSALAPRSTEAYLSTRTAQALQDLHLVSCR